MHEDKILPILYDFKRFNINSHLPGPNTIGMWEGEIRQLIWCGLNAKPGNWVEIGSSNGGSAVILSLIRKSLNLGPTIYTVDTNYPALFDQNITNGGFWNIIQKINGDSFTFKNSFPNEKISLLFIDGFHNFRWVIQDFENIKPMLVDESIICFHDTSNHIYAPNNEEYINTCLKSVNDNFTQWMNDESQNFLVDEAIVYLASKYQLQMLDISRQNPEQHFKETHLNAWKRGTTSPYSSLVAYTKKEI
jgi:predicted O-methyltransferase YrrM